MAEKPILFSGDMVRAILAGAKTQTRRVIKPQPDENGNVYLLSGDDWVPVHIARVLANGKAPYRVNDLLWVREGWRVGAWSEDDGMRIEYRADGRLSGWLRPPEEMYERLWVDSTDDATKAGLKPDENGDFYWLLGYSPTRWRPSIFMPRWASRIVLRGVDVRVQRMHAISYDDVEAEGVDYVEGITPDDWVGTWATLWDSLNAKRGFGWETNPWVWVVELELVKE